MIWASGWASSNESGTAGEPRAVLLAISEWWKRNKDRRRCEYDRLVYPQDFDPARLQDVPIDRSAWLTLFALAAFNTLGRTQDAQHRTFIEGGCRDGWWSEIAHSTPPDDVKPWLDRLRTWSGVEQVEEYQLWRAGVRRSLHHRALARRVRRHDEEAASYRSTARW